LVAVIPGYDYDKYYGGMIIASPPFNLIGLPFIPFYLCVKDKSRLLKYNEFVCKVLFAPMSLIFLFCFTAVDLLMTPIAYIYALIHKLKLVFMSKTYRPHKEIIRDFFIFLLLGPYMMLLNIPGDMYYFMKHIYSDKIAKLQNNKVSCITE